jgi:dTDP-4-dehydrorhamnose reductase
VEELREEVRHARPIAIINAATYTDVDRAEIQTELAFTVNGVAPAILAEEAKGVGAAFIHYSTDFVFNGNKGGLDKENNSPRPIYSTLDPTRI